VKRLGLAPAWASGAADQTQAGTARPGYGRRGVRRGRQLGAVERDDKRGEHVSSTIGVTRSNGITRLRGKSDRMADAA
jgi:hypothetical protein